MNKNAIKTYAIWARNELITRVTQKAYEYGVSKDNIINANATSINGKLLTNDEKKQRKQLINDINYKGFDQVIEEVAYTWFNRFIALRFMEVNNYLPKRIRIFTNENNEFKPQILDEAMNIDLEGLDKELVFDLLEKNKKEELYKHLIIATCNDMGNYLPGMFTKISDYKVLLFPDNILKEENVAGRLITDIDEDSWLDQVQIIGWMYQYYNTDNNELVYTGSMAKQRITKELLPAATTIYTPDWIVKYMVENSLGRIWIEGHDVEVKKIWKYYLDEVEQEKSVEKQLLDIKSEHSKLNPEDIKVIDPCMGSGHILVYAFDVLMQIYTSNGWSERDAAKSILQNNIYGLDIDYRAYQLSYFSLMMKARSYNRRIFRENIKPNVYEIIETNNMDSYMLNEINQSLGRKLYNTFYDAKEYGSIIDVTFTADELECLEKDINEYDFGLFEFEKNKIIYLLELAKTMSKKYEVIITNPPYLNSSRFSPKLAKYVNENYKEAKADLSMVMYKHCLDHLSAKNGHVSFITTTSWMFLSSFESFRKYLINNLTFSSLVDLGSELFDGKVGHNLIVSWVTLNAQININGIYVRLSNYCYSNRDKKEPEFFNKSNYYICSNEMFKKIPGSPIAYDKSNVSISHFSRKCLGELTSITNGLFTCDNNRFLRLWSEVNLCDEYFDCESKSSCIESEKKWFPYNKGGDFRRWYGNQNYVVNFKSFGKEISEYRKMKGQSESFPGQSYYFKDSISWSAISSSKFGVRYYQKGFCFDIAGSSLFTDDYYYYLGLLASEVTLYYLNMLNPTINFQIGDIRRIPVIVDNNLKNKIDLMVLENINYSKKDWDSYETSWNFMKHPMVNGERLIKSSFNKWRTQCNTRFYELKKNEETLNKYFIGIYGLDKELDYCVNDDDVTVHYIKDTNEDIMFSSNFVRTINDEIKSFISYGVGCMFGRYSLDLEGLAYAGGDWDNSKYSSFIPDSDNIIPICDDEYFSDDIVGRFVEFVKVVYGEDTLEENLMFISNALGGKGTPREVLRNYFLNDFYKDHCNTYQVTGSGKRPIYWLFDSGKKNGFKALIYIHRYTPDLIARMRTQYIHEQQSRYRNQIEMLERQVEGDISTSERVKLQKQLKKFKEQDEELRVYEEKIHHWADKMEPMNLDDGVKANYAKFQELLAKIK